MAAHHAHPIHQATDKSPLGNLTTTQSSFYQQHNILHHETFILTPQNTTLFTQSWRPAASEPSALVAMIHGYTSCSSWLFELTAIAIAKQGFLAVSLDLPGHGRSSGPHTHLPSIDPVVSDCILVFDETRKAHPSLPAFLYGESLGGAIAVLVALRQKSSWTGLVLNGAMCGVSTKFKPLWPLEAFLPLAAFFIPTWRAIFTESLVETAYKEEWKRRLARNSPWARRCDEHPTYASALEFMRVAEEIERRCGDLELAVLILHGSEDAVCDCESAELVYELVGSKDKSLEILKGMWHQLVGESEEIVELGFGIIFDWINKRAKKSM